MTDEQIDNAARRRQARHQAHELAKVAKAISGTLDAARARALAQQADRLAGQIRLALAKAHDPQGDAIKQTVADGLEPILQAYAAQLSEDLPGVGFSLLVFHDGLTNYFSNCARDDIVAAMHEFIAMHELDQQTAELGGMTVAEHQLPGSEDKPE